MFLLISNLVVLDSEMWSHNVIDEKLSANLEESSSVWILVDKSLSSPICPIFANGPQCVFRIEKTEAIRPMGVSSAQREEKSWSTELFDHIQQFTTIADPKRPCASQITAIKHDLLDK